MGVFLQIRRIGWIPRRGPLQDEVDSSYQALQAFAADKKTVDPSWGTGAKLERRRMPLVASKPNLVMKSSGVVD